MAYRDLLEYMCESLSANNTDKAELMNSSRKVADCVKNLISCAEVSKIFCSSFTHWYSRL